MYFVLAVSAALAVAAFVEYWVHLRRLQAIPIRILVNGTRGKSTVTRLIAAGLAAGGLRTYAKTTGSAARLIFPDLHEKPIQRRGPANARVSIMEHRWFVREAHNGRAQAIVAECMAIQPETIWTLETRLAHSTIGVITNVRLDHMDTMGRELSSVAESLAESVPEGGLVFVGSEGMNQCVESIFAHRAAQRGTKLRLVCSDDAARSMCADFSYPLFAQNMALALAVCEECGVPREVALRGMHGAAPDPGVRPSLEFAWRGIAVRLVNAFAANEVQSTLELWRLAGAPPRRGSFRTLVFNHREDRAWRAFQLGELALGMEANAILVYGMSERLAERTVRGYYRKKCFQTEQECALRIPVIRTVRDTDAGALLEIIRNVGRFDAAEPVRIEILCAGNIKGPGIALTESFIAMSSRETEKTFLGRV